MRRRPGKVTVSRSQAGKIRTANIRVSSRSTVVTSKASIRIK